MPHWHPLQSNPMSTVSCSLISWLLSANALYMRLPLSHENLPFPLKQNVRNKRSLNSCSHQHLHLRMLVSIANVFRGIPSTTIAKIDLFIKCYSLGEFFPKIESFGFKFYRVISQEIIFICLIFFFFSFI